MRGWGGSAGGSAGHRRCRRCLRAREPAPHATPLHASLPCRCLWLNFEGNEVPYTVLAPGERKRYSTW